MAKHASNTPAVSGGGVSNPSLLGLFQYAPAGTGTVVNLLYLDFSPLVSSTGDPLTVSFTTNPTGQGSTRVLVRLTGAVVIAPNASSAAWMGLMNHVGGAVMGNITVVMYIDTTGGTDDILAVYPFSCAIVVSGLTPNTAYQFDWAGAGYTNRGSSPYMAVGAVTVYTVPDSNCLPTMEVWAA